MVTKSNRDNIVSATHVLYFRQHPSQNDTIGPEIRLDGLHLGRLPG